MKNTTSAKLLKPLADSSATPGLVEMEGDSSADDSQEEMSAESSGDDRVKAAFRAALIAAFDDDSLDMKATLGRIKEILAAHDKLAGGGKQEHPSGNSTDGASQETAESHRIVELESRLALMESEKNARALLESEGVEAAEEFVEAVALLESQAKKAALVGRLPRRKTAEASGLSRRPKRSAPIETLESSRGEFVPEFTNTHSVVSFLRGNG